MLVLTPNRRVARWAAQPFAVGLRVWVIGPDQGRRQGRRQDRGQGRGGRGGRAEGELVARRAVLLRLAERAGLELTPHQRQRIAECPRVTTLDLWIDRVLQVRSTRELFAAARPRRTQA